MRMNIILGFTILLFLCFLILKMELCDFTPGAHCWAQSDRQFKHTETFYKMSRTYFPPLNLWMYTVSDNCHWYLSRCHFQILLIVRACITIIQGHFSVSTTHSSLWPTQWRLPLIKQMMIEYTIKYTILNAILKMTPCKAM